jgi:putative glycerol-1-phosphate prenyltransferase
MSIINNIKSSQKPKLAVLIDPENIKTENLNTIINHSNNLYFDYFFIGGSIVSNSVDELILQIKAKTKTKVILFPGSPLQFSKNADTLLLLSLISGRNPDLLIGQHVISAKMIKQSGIEVIPTGYILIQSDKVSTTEYISNTKPIPYNKIEIAVATAIAGELLGLKMIYLEAGSGSNSIVNQQLIQEVKKNISIPLIVGGGIKNTTDYELIVKSGADIIVVGTAFEENPNLIIDFYNYLKNI